MGLFKFCIPPSFVSFLLLRAIPVHAAPKFEKWFPKSGHIWARISTDTCNVTLKRFQDEFSRLGGAAWIDIGLAHGQIFQLCYDHESCILNNTPADIQAIMQSSNVILGLLPTLLAVLSPSIPEIALLSSHRPILSALLSLGAPGVLQTRIFEYIDPAEVLGSARCAPTQLALGPWDKKASAWLSAAEYIIAIGAIINMLHLVIEIGTRSILNWGCTKSWPPILWALCPLIIHGFAAVGYRLALEQSSKRRKVSEVAQITLALEEHKSSRETTMMHRSFTVADTAEQSSLRKMRTWVARELTPCAQHSPTLSLRLPKNHRDARMNVGIFLHCLAGFLAFVHLLYGTVTFSSFMFVHAIDAMWEIMPRFLMSALACRLVVLVEVAGMRGARVNMGIGR